MMTRTRALLYAFLIVCGTALIMGGVTTHAQNNPPVAWLLETGQYGYWIVVPGIANETACHRLHGALYTKGYIPPHRCFTYEVAR